MQYSRKLIGLVDYVLSIGPKHTGPDLHANFFTYGKMIVY